ncbi:uncharacterized protein EV154DRAFT_498167 [Mucor mucedo]|uniref:uncharacterized protein n=1 Tax=Mucor mucedo TaxID=29922 RepID=UPI0022204F6A|nr:uncharacterized protein EV154DRAFT_498167 [Mucor mucedo]KAI7894551.1 hypothetical protein EV154DRAFT_498167 [Mucor mucedo]
MPSLRVIDTEDQVLEPITQTLCEICQKQFSNYVCPRCNLRYCSLACYKDLQHAECTESFYKDSVTAEIQNRELDKDSKNKMLEMLKRLEEDNDPSDLLDQDDNDDEDQDEQHHAMLERFANIDLDNTDPDLIWDLLSDQERKEFEGVLSELQHSGDWDKLDLPTYIPWWKEAISLIQDDDEEEEEKSKVPELPDSLPDFEKMTQPATRHSPHLAWNLLNILATYSYSMRHAMGDLLEDPQDTINITKALSADVLYSNAAECPYTSVTDVVGDIVERIIQLEDKSDIHKRGKLNNHRRYDLKILLLHDLQDLLKESRRATADFWQTLKAIGKKRKSDILAARKLYFYLAAACYLDKDRIDILNTAISHALTQTTLQKEDFQKDFEAAQDAIQQHQQQKENEAKIKIQEI